MAVQWLVIACEGDGLFQTVQIQFVSLLPCNLHTNYTVETATKTRQELVLKITPQDACIPNI